MDSHSSAARIEVFSGCFAIGRKHLPWMTLGSWLIRIGQLLGGNACEKHTDFNPLCTGDTRPHTLDGETLYKKGRILNLVVSLFRLFCSKRWKKGRRKQLFCSYLDSSKNSSSSNSTTFDCTKCAVSTEERRSSPSGSGEPKS